MKPITSLAVLLLTMAAFVQPLRANTKSSSFDRKFVIEAAQGNLLEVLLGQLAQSHSDNPQVQEFGAILERDHSMALEQTRQLAAELGISLPGLSDEQRKILRHFQKLFGEEFDEEFDIFMIEDHIQDIAKYEKAALRAKNPDVRAYARNSLPILAEHLR